MLRGGRVGIADILKQLMLIYISVFSNNNIFLLDLNRRNPMEDPLLLARHVTSIPADSGSGTRDTSNKVNMFTVSFISVFLRIDKQGVLNLHTMDHD